MDIFESLAKTKPLLIKVTSAEFAKSFLEGNIFMNSVDYFRKIEDKGKEMTCDHSEGYGYIEQSSNFDYLYYPNAFTDGSDWKFDSNYLVGGVFGGADIHQCAKIFCMYRIGYDLEKKLIQPIDRRILDFGESYVLITNIIEFVRRINRAIVNRKNTVDGFACFAPVEYVDEMEYSGYLGPFKKVNKYQWQNEFRLCIDLKEKDTKPFNLEIGDISGIAISGRISKLVDGIKFEGEDSIFIPK